MTTPSIPHVDHAVLKTNQFAIISLSVVEFILNAWWLAGLVAAVMLTGAALGRALFGLAVRRVVAYPADKVADNPEPHRFAQGLGGTFVLLGTLAGLAGAGAVGWGLVWMVVALAALNAFGGFCVGCFIYYWLARFKVPGFTKLPPAGSAPGFRPKAG